MEIVIAAYILIVLISSLPSWALWRLVGGSIKFGVVTPNRMTIASMALAIVSAAALDVELDGGILSVPAIVVVLSLIWSLILILMATIFKARLALSNASGAHNKPVHPTADAPAD